MATRVKEKAGARQRPLPKDNWRGGPSVLNRRKSRVLRLFLAISIPPVLLGMLELTLRLAGFGYPTAFLLRLQHGGQTVLVQNNQFGWRFFGPAMARMPEPLCVPRVKRPNTVRIIVFGESAALGDPQPRFGLSRMLQALLELRHPGTHFEVINAAMVAINSNVILPIARDCANADADIWVVYMGNNEVVGPFGAGTVFGRQVPPLSLIRASLALKSTRVGQLMEATRSTIARPPRDRNEWGGMEMFLNEQVGIDDPRMKTVYDHFYQNLRRIVGVGRKSGAGIVASTVAVNLKDCAPFASAHRQGLAGPDLEAWQRLYQNGAAAQTGGRTAEAACWYRQAEEIDAQFAELRFRHGCCALALGETTEAQRHFAAARDLDTLRFRCDSSLNNLIRQAVSGCADPHVRLADAERTFAEQSRDGLPGSEWFYEHVHLTFHGNYLLALTLAPKVESLLPGKATAPVAANRPWPSEADCAQRLAWSDWDRQKALVDIYSRLGDPPFTGQLNHDEQAKNLEASLRELIPAAAQGPGLGRAKAWCESALAAAPDDPRLREQLAELDEISGDLREAEHHERRAVDLLPCSPQDWSQLGVTLAKEEKYGEAEAAFRRAFRLNPEDAWALQNLAQSLKHLGRRDEAMREYRHALRVKPRFGPAWLGLGQVLEERGEKGAAEDCYHKALENRIDRAPELTALARFCEFRGWREAAATNFDEAIRLNPAEARLHLEAGQNLSLLGRHAEAGRHFAEASRLGPDSLRAHFLYGMELGRAGRPAEAATQFREAVRIQPDMPEARLNLGISLVDAGEDAEAAAQFAKVLELDPANDKARQYARALRQKHSTAQPFGGLP